MSGNNINNGTINGTSVAIGSGAVASVVNNGANQRELLELLAALREQVEKADLPENAKQVVLAGPVQQMETAAKAPDPKPQIKHGLERLNDQLQVLGVTASSVKGIVGTISKIASLAGVVMHGLPFLAGLL